MATYLQADNPEVPQYHKLIWTTVQAMRSLGSSGSNQEINDGVIDLVRLTETQQTQLHDDGPMTEFAYRMHWARSYLKLFGAATNTSRGVWALTELGRTISGADALTIPAQVRANARRARNQAQAALEVESDANPETLALADPDRFTSTDPDEWRQALLDALIVLSPDGFERLCQRLLREAGFTSVEVTGRSGDGGIDGIGVLRVALLSFHVFFQCKRYRGSVGASAIRDFRGAMVGRTDKGLLITTGTFTPDAKREATRDGAPVLDLVDGDALCALLKGHELGVSTALVEEVTIDKGWFGAL